VGEMSRHFLLSQSLRDYVATIPQVITDVPPDGYDDDRATPIVECRILAEAHAAVSNLTLCENIIFYGYKIVSQGIWFNFTQKIKKCFKRQ
jgi:hypothetical protein